MKSPNSPKRDYLLIFLNVMIVLLLIGSLALTLSGQRQALIAFAGPMGLLVILAGLRRRRR